MAHVDGRWEALSFTWKIAFQGKLRSVSTHPQKYCEQWTSVQLGRCDSPNYTDIQPRYPFQGWNIVCLWTFRVFNLHLCRSLSALRNFGYLLHNSILASSFSGRSDLFPPTEILLTFLVESQSVEAVSMLVQLIRTTTNKVTKILPTFSWGYSFSLRVVVIYQFGVLESIPYLILQLAPRLFRSYWIPSNG